MASIKSSPIHNYGENMRNICAVIQAGGLGTRMREKSSSIPKHLLPVCGVPMVERILRQLISCGVRKVFIITGYLGEKIEAHFLSLKDLPADLKLDYIRETIKRGDIGSLADVPEKADTTIWIYGDLVTDLNFSKLLDIHFKREGSITLASHYEFHQVGLGELIVQGDKVIHYLEKPTKKYLICSGIAAIDASVLPLVETSIPMGLDELVEKALSHDFNVTHWRHGAFWVDVNNPDLLIKAEKGLRDNKSQHDQS
jgi:NDP-sugar pyrophosphorylase family protein